MHTNLSLKRRDFKWEKNVLTSSKVWSFLSSKMDKRNSLSFTMLSDKHCIVSKLSKTTDIAPK